MVEDPGFRPEPMDLIFKAGQSKRVWGELYKVKYVWLFKNANIASSML